MLTLLDGQNRPLGQVEIERVEGDLLLGKFQARPEFAAVAQLFHEFEEAANSQGLALVEKLDRTIAALGLTLRLPDGSRSVDIYDVQIWRDGAITCRAPTFGETGWNGRTNKAHSDQVARSEG